MPWTVSSHSSNGIPAFLLDRSGWLTPDPVRRATTSLTNMSATDKYGVRLNFTGRSRQTDSTADSTIDGPHTDGNGIRGVDVHEYHLMTRCLVLTPRNGKCKRRRWKVEEDQQFSQDDQRPAKI